MGGAWQPGWDAHNGKRLATGGMGVTFVYRRLDNSGKVIDRVVVKDQTFSREAWLYFPTWHWDALPTNRVPMEVFAMQKILGKADSDKCVQYRAHDIKHDTLWLRLYMSYAQHKDLGDYLNQLREDPQRFVHEPTLRSLFEDIVRGTLLFTQGGVAPEQNWPIIVHRDLKIDNILLDTRDNNDPNYRGFARAQVADFGLAIETYDGDPQNPNAYTTFGTPGWTPRELELLQDKETLQVVPGPKIGEKTNVWGVGAIIMRMMNLDNADGDRPKPEWHNELPRNEPVFNMKARTPGRYSEELMHLVRRCVAFDPKDRPTLNAILEEILRWTTPGQAGVDLAEGRRVHGAGPDAKDMWLTMKRHGPKDGYRMGFMVPREEGEQYSP